jgi:hypothetical protein
MRFEVCNKFLKYKMQVPGNKGGMIKKFILVIPEAEGCRESSSLRKTSILVSLILASVHVCLSHWIPAYAGMTKREDGDDK